MIEDQSFELLEHFENRRELWPDRLFAGTDLEDELDDGTALTCARYTFYTSGWGDGGFSEYVLDASLRHPTLHFVECWICPDASAIGLSEICNGEFLDDVIINKEDDSANFERMAAQWLNWHFDDDE
jgi:hypothetical protein